MAIAFGKGIARLAAKSKGIRGMSRTATAKALKLTRKLGKGGKKRAVNLPGGAQGPMMVRGQSFRAKAIKYVAGSKTRRRITGGVAALGVGGGAYAAKRKRSRARKVR